MFELPEFQVLARQMSDHLTGKTIRRGQLGNSPHKFVWYNRTHEEFEQLTKGKVVGQAKARAKWLFLPLDPEYLLLLGECGGTVLLNPPGAKLPRKYHLHITFEDDTFLTVTTQMWGAMELHLQGEEQERQYIKDMKTTPLDPEFTLDYFRSLVAELAEGKARSAKALLTQDQMIPGLGNAIAQDILFRARLSPKRPISAMSTDEIEALCQAIMETVAEVIEKGGRYDEYDLFGRKGGYVRHMDSQAVRRPCPECGGGVQKIQYLGGACYFCPACQQ